MAFFTVNYKTTTTFSVAVEAADRDEAWTIGLAVANEPVDNEDVERATYQSSDQIVEVVSVDDGTLYPSRALTFDVITLPEHDMPLSYARHIEGN